MAASFRCGWVLNALRVNRSPEKRNSLQEQLRDIQLTCKVSCAERFRARCMATAIGPPDVTLATRSPGPPAARNFASPRFTREQNSDHVSTPSDGIAPLTHLPMTASNKL